MKAAVVGGGGFIGRHLAARLVENGIDVVTVDRAPPEEPLVREEVVDLDVAADAAGLVAACSGVEAVIWLAAQIRQATTVDDAVRDDLALSVEAPLRLLRSLEPAPESFAYASSIQVYGYPRTLPVDETHPLRPFTAYGVAKLAGEQFLGLIGASRRTAVSSLRLAFVYGPGQHPANALPRFVAAARAGVPPTIRGDGAEIRDDVHVDDVAAAFLAALERRAVGAFNISSGYPHTLLDVAETVCRLAGLSGPRVERGPSSWIDRWYAIDRARVELGYAPNVSFEDGIRELLRRS
jgi:UDP-glucose 4-epimerase